MDFLYSYSYGRYMSHICHCLCKTTALSLVKLYCINMTDTKFKLHLFYNDYETSYTTYINYARWHR